MTVVDDFLASELAKLSRVAAQPREPFGYGRDLSCVGDIDPRLAEVTGARAIAESLARRFTCPRGGLIDDPDYGYDLRAHLNRGATTAEIIAVGAILRGEGLKDDRIAELEITVTITQDYRSLRVAARITPEDPDLRPFSATFALENGTVALEEMSK